jgi:outer membrane biosynthesis protein TonB
VKIVEDARKERAETSGAQAGGPTAAFLRGEESDGERLIGDLVAAPDAPAPASAKAEPRPAPASVGPARDVLRELTEVAATPAPAPTAAPKPAPEAPAPTATPTPTPAPTAPSATPAPASRPAQKSATDVDRSVIDDLLGGGGGS